MLKGKSPELFVSIYFNL